jgi:hypothetical protein
VRGGKRRGKGNEKRKGGRGKEGEGEAPNARCVGPPRGLIRPWMTSACEKLNAVVKKAFSDMEHWFISVWKEESNDCGHEYGSTGI